MCHSQQASHPDKTSLPQGGGSSCTVARAPSSAPGQCAARRSTMSRASFTPSRRCQEVGGCLRACSTFRGDGCIDETTDALCVQCEPPALLTEHRCRADSMLSMAFWSVLGIAPTDPGPSLRVTQAHDASDYLKPRHALALLPPAVTCSKNRGRHAVLSFVAKKRVLVQVCAWCGRTCACSTPAGGPSTVGGRTTCRRRIRARATAATTPRASSAGNRLLLLSSIWARRHRCRGLPEAP